MIIINKSIMNYRDRFGRERESYHLSATETLTELHEFAGSIGLKISWFQRKSIVPHYDIFGSMIDRARAKGAKEVSHSEFLKMTKRLARLTRSVKCQSQEKKS
jgi:hypothetical protein